jgi:hypothetical protein
VAVRHVDDALGLSDPRHRLDLAAVGRPRERSDVERIAKRLRCGLRYDDVPAAVDEEDISLLAGDVVQFRSTERPWRPRRWSGSVRREDSGIAVRGRYEDDCGPVGVTSVAGGRKRGVGSTTGSGIERASATGAATRARTANITRMVGRYGSGQV